MTDAKFFYKTEKVDRVKIKHQLNSIKMEKRTKAVKKVIAAMTVGEEDVSELFPDVLNCIQTKNTELKKLAYLFLMHYAKSQPDMAIMAVNTFVKDCVNANPLIRALAIRTMGCIRVDKVAEYLVQPLRRALEDEDAYVRKAAAVCVAKLHDINAEMAEDHGFLHQLQNLLTDTNPHVVANAVSALSEIQKSSSSGQPSTAIDAQTINKLLTALTECTEWGQVSILDQLADYVPKDETEATRIAESVTSRLAHKNSAVVLSTVKVIIKMMEVMSPDSMCVKKLTEKLGPPLLGLLSGEPEVQYVALRNISLIVQKRPDILKKDISPFLLRHSDPIYVKLEKIDIMVRLATEGNVSRLIAELKQYAAGRDVELVRSAVRGIGRTAITVEVGADKCVKTLDALIKTRKSHVVQEAAVVIKDIFRKYPNKYLQLIITLADNLDSLKEPEARASMIWIIGEYASRITTSHKLLEELSESFKDENTQVQLQLLTAVVKLSLKSPNETQGLLQRVLDLATEDSEDPVVGDRALFYRRLLSADRAAAKEVVFSASSLITEVTDRLEPRLLDELIVHIGSLASVLHKRPSDFVEGRLESSEKASTSGDEPSSTDDLIGSLLDIDLDGDTVAAPPTPPAESGASSVDLLTGEVDTPLSDIGTTDTPPDGATGLLDILDAGPPANFYTPPKQIWLPAAGGQYLQISGTFTVRNTNHICMEMTLENKSMQAMYRFNILFNKNSFGLACAEPLQVPTPLLPNTSADASLLLSTMGSVQKRDPLTILEVAVKVNDDDDDVQYFSTVVPLHVFCTTDGTMDWVTFLATWRDIPAQNELQFTMENIFLSADQVSEKLQDNRIFTVSKRDGEGHQAMLYQSLKLTNGIWVLAAMRIEPDIATFSLLLKSRFKDVLAPVLQSYNEILHN